MGEAQGYEYDVALSYAGEDRVIVEKIALGLRDAGLNVFYDGFEKSSTLGANLYNLLEDVYRKKARFCVVFLSASYAKKAWTSHELQSAQARLLESQEAYLLPVRLDDTVIPGLRPTIGYIDFRSLTEPRDESLLAHLVQRIGNATVRRTVGKTGKRRITVLVSGGKEIDRRARELSYALGVQLIKSDWNLVTGTAEGVDTEVAKGADFECQSQGIPGDERIIAFSRRGGTPKHNFGRILQSVYGTRYTNTVEMVRNCEIGIILGGRASTGYLAKDLLNENKFVIPIAVAGGAAEEVWKEMQSDLRRYYDERMSPQLFGRLNDRQLGQVQLAQQAIAVASCLLGVGEKRGRR